MRRSLAFTVASVVIAASGLLLSTPASAAPAPGLAAATSCPASGGDSINFNNKSDIKNATNGPISIHLEDGYRPSNRQQYVWTYIQNASAGDQAWVSYTNGGGYITCGLLTARGPGAYYTTSYLTSASSAVHMKACAKDASTRKTVCTAAY